MPAPIKCVSVRRGTFRSIAADGLAYHDDVGQSCWIDFAACRANWVLFVNSGEEFPNVSIREEDSRCIAWRDAAHNPPYIEFFTQPRTRFEFGYSPLPLGRWLLRMTHAWYRDFAALQHQILWVGWTSYDLS